MTFQRSGKRNEQIVNAGKERGKEILKLDEKKRKRVLMKKPSARVNNVLENI